MGERDVTVRALCNLMEHCPFNGFPVVEPGTRRFCGMARRGVLLHVLRYGREHGAFRGAGQPVDDTGASAMVPDAAANGQRLPKWPVEAYERLERDDYAKSVDISPYIDHATITVQPKATLRRAYTLFRTMGFRYLAVVEDGMLVGMLTRSEFFRAHEV